jgi:hypothetical protein
MGSMVAAHTNGFASLFQAVRNASMEAIPQHEAKSEGLSCYLLDIALAKPGWEVKCDAAGTS